MARTRPMVKFCVYVMAFMGAVSVEEVEAAPVQALIIGGGVAGLRAALDLATKGHRVTLLEGRDRLGGRIASQNTAAGPLETGAQWLHGKNNPIYTLFQQKGWTLLPSDAESSLEYEAISETEAKMPPLAEELAWDGEFEGLEDLIGDSQDGPDGRGLSWAVKRYKSQEGLDSRERLGLDMLVDSAYAQEYGADIDSLSLNWFDDGADETGGDMIPAAGFGATLIEDLKAQITAKNVTVVLGAFVEEVEYSEEEGVKVLTAAGAAYAADYAVVTLPLGVLQAKAVRFYPRLPREKAQAISRLGMGTLNKVMLEFPAGARWPGVNWVSRIPLRSDKGRWREFFMLRNISGRHVIVAFNAGKSARYPASTSDTSLVAGALSALRAMFGPTNIPDPTASVVTRWHSDPFSLGSYSYYKKGCTGVERANLAKPVGKLLYWAGEATDTKHAATVHGAYAAGGAAAAQAAADHK
ncbi:MAG: amine oxidase [Monoraphidium minutum]|nr:MAG: amine oxidase [Monoraphidium minutum]